MKQIGCYYHPNEIEAVTNCESCQRPVCLNHLMKYRRHGGMDRADDVYELCTDCHRQQSEMARQAMGEFQGKMKKMFGGFFIGIIIIIVVFIIIAASLFAGFAR